MLYTTTSRINLQKGDYVMATFKGVNDFSEEKGEIEKFNNEEITIKRGNSKKTYGTWQLTSLICPKKDIHFARETDPYLTLERCLMRL